MKFTIKNLYKKLTMMSLCSIKFTDHHCMNQFAYRHVYGISTSHMSSPELFLLNPYSMLDDDHKMKYLCRHHKYKELK